MEGVFAAQRPTHPFRIIESDAMSIHSMTSLGRVGRILAGSIDVSNISIERETASALQNAQQSDIAEGLPSAEQPVSRNSQKDDIITHQHIEKQHQIVFQGKNDIINAHFSSYNCFIHKHYSLRRSQSLML